MKTFPIGKRWCVHGYYSLCPYAPENSGRFLIVGADLALQKAEVLVLAEDGRILNRFDSGSAPPSFWHTDLWQS